MGARERAAVLLNLPHVYTCSHGCMCVHPWACASGGCVCASVKSLYMCVSLLAPSVLAHVQTISCVYVYVYV